MANWQDGSVNKLFIKVRDTMPPGNTDSLSPEVKLTIVTHLLRENGFPSGTSELALNADILDSLQITKKGEDAGAPNFSLVQVVGCLDARRGVWIPADKRQRARGDSRQRAKRRRVEIGGIEAARPTDVSA